MKHLIQSIPTLAFCLLLASCGGSFEPVKFGKDACAHCRMTIIDARFAAEWISDKGKVFKFDDLRCVQEFMAEEGARGGAIYLADFAAPGGDFVKAEAARLVQHHSITSPMGGGTIAFATEAAAKKVADSLGAKITAWNALK